MRTIWCAAWAVVSMITGALAAPPETPKAPVVDEYHGVKVPDDYRWLEDWDKQKVKSWSEAQNVHARSVLDALPNVAPVRARLTTLLSSASVRYSKLRVVKGQTFAVLSDPSKQQPMLVVMPSVHHPDKARVLVDPNTIDPTGATTIDWYSPSPDGKLVAVSMSSGGSESGDVHLFNVATGKDTQETVPRVHGGTAGGSLAWTADSRSFFYTRYPRIGERPAEDVNFYVKVYSHSLGNMVEHDMYEIGRDFPKIAEIVLETSKDGDYTLASVQKGDGGEFMHFLRGPARGVGASGTKVFRWTQLTKYEDGVVSATFGDGCVYMVSRKDTPRGKVLRLALGADTPPEVFIPQHDKWSIHTDFFETAGVTPAAGAVYVEYMAGGPSDLRAFDQHGKELPPFFGNPTMPSLAANEVVDAGDFAVIQSESFLEPAAWFTHKPGEAAMTTTPLKETSPARLAGLVTERATVKSKDGTQIPITILRREKFEKNGSNPTVLWGYGGYGVCETPHFSPARAVWLEQGGVYVIANIRGGGEFGEEWHKAGNLTHKQNVFDDFAAVGKWLVDQKYTRADRLAIQGGSNGGLLMGATFTQHPDLCKAVVSSVGIYDMLRVELSSNGAFNITEFGTVKDPEQFKALYAYSPYHHVIDGTRYPAILFLTGANDPRVDPMQSRKMTARLQAANPGGTVLLRTSGNSGHGIGTPLAERIEQSVDIYSFLFNQLGLEYVPLEGSASGTDPTLSPKR